MFESQLYVCNHFQRAYYDVMACMQMGLRDFEIELNGGPPPHDFESEALKAMAHVGKCMEEWKGKGLPVPPPVRQKGLLNRSPVHWYEFKGKGKSQGPYCSAMKLQGLSKGQPSTTAGKGPGKPGKGPAD